MSLHAMEKYDASFDSFKEAIDNGVNTPAVLSCAVDCLIELNKKREAIKYLDKLLKINPSDVNSLINKGAALSHLKRYKEAIEYFDKALTIKNDSLMALTNKGVALKKMKKYNEAIECLSKSFKVSCDKNHLISLGCELKWRGELRLAKKCFEEVLSVKSDEFALSELADCLLELDEKKLAAKYYNEIVDISKDEEILECALISLKELGCPIEKCADKLFTVNPENETALIEKGIKLTKQGKYSLALDYLSKVSDNSEEYLSSIAACLEKTGRFKDAKKYYQKTHRLNKSAEIAEAINRCSSMVSHEKAILKKRKSIEKIELSADYSKLIEICTSILDETPDDCDILEKKAGSLLRLGMKDEALKCYEKLVGLTSDERILANTLDAYKQLGADSGKCCDKLIRINPQNEQANIEKGIYFTKNGDYYNASAHFNNVKTENTSDECIKYMAVSQYKLCRYSKAAEYFRRIFGKQIDDNRLLLFYIHSLLKIKKQGIAKEILDDALQSKDYRVILGYTREIEDKNELQFINSFVLEQVAVKSLINQKYDEAVRHYLKLLGCSQEERIVKNIKEIVEKHDSMLTVNTKSMLDLHSHKELVIVDSNILIFKVFYDLKGIMNLIDDKRCLKAFERFQELSISNFICLTEIVKREISLVWPTLFEAYSQKTINCDKKEIRGQIARRIAKYERKYSMENFANQEGCLFEKELSEVEGFYKRFPYRLKEITVRKIKELSEHEKNKKLLARSYGRLPERSDMQILAHAVRLNKSCIAGVKKIAILTDDSDFVKFSSEIEEQFNVKIYPLQI